MNAADGAMPGLSARFDRRRLLALVRKESLQALRDPSTLLIAFALPVVLLFLFAYAVSLDARHVRIGVVVESPAPSAQSLANAFAATSALDVRFAHDRREVADQVVAGALRGFVVIPQDFEQRLAAGGTRPLVQVITDGSQPNTANFVATRKALSRPGGPEKSTLPRPRSPWSRAIGSTPSWKAGERWFRARLPSS